MSDCSHKFAGKQLCLLRSKALSRHIAVTTVIIVLNVVHHCVVQSRGVAVHEWTMRWWTVRTMVTAVTILYLLRTLLHNTESFSSPFCLGTTVVQTLTACNGSLQQQGVWGRGSPCCTPASAAIWPLYASSRPSHSVLHSTPHTHSRCGCADEIDAIGKSRGTGASDSGTAEREQGLLQLLCEMDGFKRNDKVLVIGATNRLDSLDDALIRPGRFDRTIYMGRPTTSNRFKILQVCHPQDLHSSIFCPSALSLLGVPSQREMRLSKLLQPHRQRHSQHSTAQHMQVYIY